MKAKILNFPSCCGVKEIGQFGSNIYDWDGTKRPAKIRKEDITRSGFAYICITRWSDVSYKAKLKAWGFKRIGRFKNPNTSKVLTMWAYIPKK